MLSIAALAAAAPALAATPVVSTSEVRVTGAAAATVLGSVNASGLSTKYDVAYALAEAQWCVSGGSAGVPSTTTPQTLGFTDSVSHSVAVHLTALTAGKQYCAAVQAQNSSGTATAFQFPFVAGAPIVETFNAGATGATTATVSGSVNPSGQSTKYNVLYGLASGQWCTSFGEEGSPEFNTAEASLGYTDMVEHEVAVHLTGLTAGKEYCAAIQASNPATAVTGEILSFTAGLSLPQVSTSSFESTGASAATVSGSVDASGQSTKYQAVYGLATSLWCTSFGAEGSPTATTPQVLGFTDSTGHAVAVHLTGLTAGKGYCAAIRATNGTGTATGGQLTSTAGLPLAITGFATATGATTATVSGSVNPAGQSTSYKILYSLSSEEWCTSGGTKGTPTGTTPQSLGATDTLAHAVVVHLTGLTAGKRYCAAVQATNASGTAAGAQSSFGGGEPSVSGFPKATSATTATVLGFVGPSGQSTKYRALYALATEEWCTSFGAKGSPTATAEQTLAATDFSTHTVAVHVTGLIGGKAYCAAIRASNAAGTVTSFPSTFTAGAPTAFSATPVATGSTTASVTGFVSAAGQTTTYKVLYALASEEFCTSFGAKGSSLATEPQTLGFTDSNQHTVIVHVTGLTTGKHYCATIQATNASGTSKGFTQPFVLGEPSVSTGFARSTSGSTVALSGLVGPAGQTTTYKVFYDLASSEWCESNGATSAPAGATTPQTLGYTDMTSHPVTVNITGLAAGKRYCAGLQATNATATVSGGTLADFTAGAPFAETFNARPIGPTSAALLGEVSPSGLSTTYNALYDLTTSEWCESGGATGTPAGSTSVQTLPYTDFSEHSVSVHITGLTAGKSYCGEIEANNAAGTGSGFPTTFTVGEPFAENAEAQATGATAATVSGFVNASGQSTTYKILYDLASSEWCESGGETGTPAGATTPQSLGFTDLFSHPISASISGLTAGKAYCAAVQASNATATSVSFPVTFVAGAPTVVTGAIKSTGVGSASLSGTVNPSGQSTTYKVVYDLASSEWCESGGASGTPANSTSAQALGVTDTTAHAVSVNLIGLTVGKAYCAALQATNAAATTVVAGVTQLGAGEPSVSSGGAQATSATTASLPAFINPSGQSTTYKALYDIGTSEWCESSGASSAAANSSSTQTLEADTITHVVTINLKALTAGASYCEVVQATNASGTVTSFITTFTAGAPSAFATEAQLTGLSAAALSGFVNPAGQTTTYKATYDLATSEWCESNGASGTPQSTTPQTLAFTDATTHGVTVSITGLSAGKTYCATIEASNGSGISAAFFFLVRFTPGLPLATTVSLPQVTGATTASVSASVNPGGQTTTYKALYDLASSEWCLSGGQSGAPAGNTSPQTLGFTDTASHTAAVTVSGLIAGKVYCAALQASNASGTSTAFAATFTAGAPLVETLEAQATGATTASVSGSVNPSGQTTTYKVLYDLASSEWCESEGATGTPAGATSAATLGFTDTSEHQVTVQLTGLTDKLSYCAELQATSGSVTGTSFPVAFTAGATPPTPPTAVTGAASAVTQTGATLNATVNPNGANVTDCTFEYGTTTAYGLTAPCSSLPGSGTSAEPASASVSELVASTTYHFRITATNGGGTNSGSDATFKTSAAPAPSVITEAASAVTETGATLNATVNPNGSSVSDCKFEYGTSTAYGSNAPCSSLPGSGTSPVAVSEALGLLAANTTYHFRISATNGTGTSKGSDLTFKTLAPAEPTAVTGAATAVTQTGATLNATVNPNGTNVTDCKFEYGPTTAYGLTTTCASLPGTGTAAVPVTASVTELQPNTTYHFRISATNAGGTNKGSDETLKTQALIAPTVVTGAASAVTQNAASVSATVNPNGSNVTDCKFEYGPTTAYGSTATCASSPGAGTSAVPVTANLTALTPNTTYHFRISATNGIGPSIGSDETLHTLALAAPAVVTQAASGVGQTAATLHATVNPNGSNVSDCKLEYGTSTAYSATPVPCVSLPGEGTAPVAVTANLTGLQPNTTYHFRISATNIEGTSKGLDETVKTAAIPPPSVETGPATAVAQTTATLNASVNPNGTSVTDCKFEWGTSAAYGASAPCASSPGSGSGAVAVSAALSGLAANTTYHFRISATNSGGPATGADASFTTPAEASAAGGGGGTTGGGTTGGGSTGSSGGTGGGSTGGGTGAGAVPTAAQIAAQLTPTGKGARILALLKHGGFALSFHSVGPGTLVINWYELPKGAKLAGKKAKPVLVATGRASFATAATATVNMHLTAAGKHLLKTAKQLKITAQAIFTPKIGAAVKTTRTFVLKR